jgi:sugar/nucleoside kinase (ribokinase family)
MAAFPASPPLTILILPTCTESAEKSTSSLGNIIGTSAQVGDIRIVSGGDAGNAAITLARLGVRSALGSVVGGDMFGRDVLSLVAQSGVVTDYIKVVPELSTSVSVVLVNKSGERLFLFSGSSIETIEMDDIATTAFKQSRHVNYGSLCGLPRLDQCADKILKLAKEAGCTTSMDMTGNESEISFEKAKNVLKYVDYFMPSYREAKLLSGETEPERAADFFVRETGEKVVVIKLGKKGCFVKSGAKCYTVPAFGPDAVDATGAGDSFVGGFLAGLMQGWDVERCARLGNGAAGFNTQFIGATTLQMSMERVLEFMGE